MPYNEYKEEEEKGEERGDFNHSIIIWIYEEKNKNLIFYINTFEKIHKSEMLGFYSIFLKL